MSVASGPKLVTDGLIFTYDMYNNRSWKGAPTTNVYPESTVNYGIANFSQVSSTELDPAGTFTARSWTIPNTAAQAQFWYPYTSTANMYTYSVWLKASTPTTVWLYPQGTDENEKVSVSVTTQWQRFSVSRTISTTKNVGGLIRIFSGFSGTLYTWGHQIEAQSFATPYVPTNGTASTRTDIQAILDLTGINTITANSLTYDSDGTFRFNGVNNYMTSNFAGVNTTAGGYNTVCQWLYWAGSPNGFPINFGSGYRLWMPSGYLGFNNGQSDCYGADISAHTNKWLYVASVFYNGAYTNNSKMYLNGVLQTLTQANGSATSGTASASGSIGGFTDGSYSWPGKIGQTSIYNRQLTADEVALNFNASRGRYGI